MKKLLLLPLVCCLSTSIMAQKNKAKKAEQPKASVALDKLETKIQLRASDDWMNRLSI